MLELKDIKKEYPGGGETVEALKGISLTFRRSEFVSVLGPSGCGKTTMLNIIGGLDQYTEGDLVINGRSTKDFRDRDWDTYRNHSIGFVFQSYNLIPHQTVLQNVELALTLSGVSKAERRARAKQALEEVGLASQMKKKPGEMSGGQMQRVAIARAIVNNPDIILADEPTGALDTETSVQVMEILKKIAEDRLVIMVTHNPELADRYSTRIIRMLDGVITGDSDPLSDEELRAERADLEAQAKEEREKHKMGRKPSMSFRTSFGLSLKNLFTKKGRTALTSFAGSIGIIGIALIYAVSHGTTTYIDMVQEDTLASYPLTLQAQSMDLTSMMQTFMGLAQSDMEHERDAVYQKPMVYDMVNAMNSAETTQNDLRTFKAYVEDVWMDPENENNLRNAISGIQYTYDMDLLVYTENVDGTILRSDSNELMQELLLEYFGVDMSLVSSMSEDSGMSMMSAGASLWEEMLSGENGRLVSPLLENQYDVIYGSWPTDYNEIVLVVDENNEIDDMALYALGLKSKEEIDAIMRAAIDQTELAVEEQSWTYEEICDMEFRVILNSDCYVEDENTGNYVDLRETSAGLKYLYDNGISLTVSGIIRPNENASSSMLTGSIGYTSELTEYIVEPSKEADAVAAQLANPDLDIFTGLPFQENTSELTQAEKEEEFRAYVAQLDEAGRAEAYLSIMSIPSQEQIDQAVNQAVGDMERTELEETMAQSIAGQTGMSSEEILDYTSSMSDEELYGLFAEMVTEQFRVQYAEGVRTQMSAMSTQQLAYALDMAMDTYTPEQFGQYYDEVLEFSESSYESNLRELGYVDLEDPASINLYASSFENKEVIEDAIAAYNETAEEMEQITYTDYVGLIMSSVTSVINAITYVLIAFVAVSLIVSSIMIGVITLISVQERTKEIGILRAIGASKRNVSSMFNAETMIIGFTSGALGVLITYLLCIPINLILHHLTGINTLSAYLPIPTAVILVLISMGLTLFSGIIPSRSAARKDPVVALRTE